MEIDLPEYAECLFEPRRYKILYGGRGGAKSESIGRALLIMGMKTPLGILCARELQVSIADSVHKLLTNIINEHPEFESFYEVQNKAILGKNGTEFSFKGLKHNISEIKSMARIDICWVEEAQVVSDKSWETLIPTVRSEGSEIWLSFNPKNPTDPTWRRFVLEQDSDMIVKKVGWRENPFFPEVLNKERLRLYDKDYEAYSHIWEGEFDTRYSGAVYAKWLAKLQEQGRLNDRVLHDAEYPVYTLWDLGYDDTTTIWFYQLAPNEVLFIDYYENNGEGIGHYCEMLKERGYKYHTHFVPQDAGAKRMEANGRSMVDQSWKDFGIRLSVILESTHLNRHASLRKVLPHCWFNSVACADGIQAVMAYHYEYDEDRKIFKDKPVHDWSSHASTALELLGSVWGNKVTTVKDLNRREVVAKFHKLRNDNNLTERDPYRLKPRKRK